MTLNWFRLASPATFYPVAGRLIPWFAWPAALLACVGVALGLFGAPTDFQQGDAYRIIFIHVPAAWMSMFLYLVMAFWGAMSLGFNTRLSAMMAQSIAPTGALMTFIALVSGSFWGRPTWGTYWAWDARMTSELILLFLYLGVIALRSAIDDPRRADRACAVLSLTGAINVPDHLLLGQVVEHAAPGGVGAPRRIEDGDDHAGGHAHHVVRRVVLRDRRDAASRPQHHARARERRGMGRRACRNKVLKGSDAMNGLFEMGGYGFYVWSAYGVAAVVIAAEILSVRARRKAALTQARIVAGDIPRPAASTGSVR